MKRMIALALLAAAMGVAVAASAATNPPPNPAKHSSSPSWKLPNTTVPKVRLISGSVPNQDELNALSVDMFPEGDAENLQPDHKGGMFYRKPYASRMWFSEGWTLGINNPPAPFADTLNSLVTQASALDATGTKVRYVLVSKQCATGMRTPSLEQESLMEGQLGEMRTRSGRRVLPPNRLRFVKACPDFFQSATPDDSTRGVFIVKVEFQNTPYTLASPPPPTTGGDTYNVYTTGSSSDCCEQRNGLGIIAGRFNVPQCKGEYTTISVIGLRANYEWLFAEGMWAAPSEGANLTIIDVAAMYRKGIFGVGGGPLYFTYTPDGEDRGTNKSLGMMARGEASFPLGKHADLTVSGTAAWVPFDGESDRLLGVSAILNLYPGILNGKSKKGGSK